MTKKSMLECKIIVLENAPVPITDTKRIFLKKGAEYPDAAIDKETDRVFFKAGQDRPYLTTEKAAQLVKAGFIKIEPEKADQLVKADFIKIETEKGT